MPTAWSYAIHVISNLPCASVEVTNTDSDFLLQCQECMHLDFTFIQHNITLTFVNSILILPSRWSCISGDGKQVYVTSNHIALDTNLPKQSPRMIIGDFHFSTQVDRIIIPLHKSLLCSFYITILTKIWHKELSCTVNCDKDPLWLDKYGRCSQKVHHGCSRYILAYISVTTWARDFKLAGAPVQRL